MRAPRAVVPLLAVSGATVVVVTAGAGATIKGGGGGGPAPVHADGARPVAAVTVNAMSWNVCGNARHCPLRNKPSALASKISWHMQNHKVNGRKVKANAVLLQEVCSGHVAKLRQYGWLKTWSWAFAPAKKRGKAMNCSGGKGQFGVAVGTAQKLSGVRKTYLKSPAFEGRVAVCGTVAQWGTRVCATHLSSGLKADDPRGNYRKVQTQQLRALAGNGRVVFGGDLNEVPTGPALKVLYANYRECDQGDPGKGEKTHQNSRGKATAKIDYIFATKSARAACDVPNAVVGSSDHRPVTAVVSFR